MTKQYPYRDTIPFFKATYEKFGGRQLIWGTGYPRSRWELPMEKELAFSAFSREHELMKERGVRPLIDNEIWVPRILWVFFAAVAVTALILIFVDG